LDQINISPDQRTQIVSQGNDLLDLKIPDGIDPATSDSIRSAVRDSFVNGFRLVTFVSAGLALLSAVAAWALIEGKEKRK
jgi:hypothetical protein